MLEDKTRIRLQIYFQTSVTLKQVLPLKNAMSLLGFNLGTSFIVNHHSTLYCNRNTPPPKVVGTVVGS
jgi:hypothetical protein